MTRKSIPDAVQTNILTKSRRRCCLCFWLNGLDEVQAGQLAHLDQNNENNDDDNLVFLCLAHHDQYDGSTSVSKGLKESEVRHWRKMLYDEWTYQFRSPGKMELTLAIRGFKHCGPETELCAVFRLKNSGEVMARHPTVAVRLPEFIEGRKPPNYIRVPSGIAATPSFDLWAAVESRQDIFESNGRVMLWELGGAHPILMPGHSLEFEALTVCPSVENRGTTIPLDYQIDAEGFPPSRGIANARMPAGITDLLNYRAMIGEGDDEEE